MTIAVPRPNVVAPYGSWVSSVSSAVLVNDAVRFGGIVLDGDAPYWVEQRPSEAGRSVVCRMSEAGLLESVTPEGFSVRSRVHEYGGGAFTVHDGTVYFVDDRTQQIHVQRPLGMPEPLTDRKGGRYGDLGLDLKRRRIVAVAEQHHDDREPSNFLVAISIEAPHKEVVLAEGHDFYASCVFSTDGTQCAFVTWDHPDMPWEGTQLWLAGVSEAGVPESAMAIAGGANESAIEPRFSPAGELWFVSDLSGFWNLYRWHGEKRVAVLEDAAEYGRAPWQLGASNYGVLETGQVVAVRDRDGQSSLVLIDPLTSSVTVLPVAYSDLSNLCVTEHHAFFIGAGPLDLPALIRLDLVGGHLAVLKSSAALPLAPEHISIAEAISFPTGEGQRAHALYYAPCNAHFEGPEDERPPLIVMSHGGPTAATFTGLNPAIQFWTSRGFAVVDVNYRGSTGYGRTYRQALAGAWGVADVDDCVNAALFLAERGDVDRGRLAIRGGSAGGYTTLCALAFRDVFAAGASHYGIGDLEALARDTHKFESRYMDRLIGPYPEARELYRARSPIHHLEGFTSPLLLLQGLEDRVVPPLQSSAMYEAVRARGIPVAYLAFEGEQHGFRQAKNIRRSVEAELYFYGRVFGILPADELEPIDIANIDVLSSTASDL